MRHFQKLDPSIMLVSKLTETIIIFLPHRLGHHKAIEQSLTMKGYFEKRHI